GEEHDTEVSGRLTVWVGEIGAKSTVTGLDQFLPLNRIAAPAPAPAVQKLAAGQDTPVRPISFGSMERGAVQDRPLNRSSDPDSSTAMQNRGDAQETAVRLPP